MAANTVPIYPIAPALAQVSLVAAAPVTSRANIVGTTGLVELSAATTNGRRVDKIEVKGQGTTVASIVSIWAYDGTTSRLIDEIDVPLNGSASTTVDSSLVSKSYNNLVLPPNTRLYVSQTIATNVNITLYGGDY
jgi:hypothetical protein